MYTCLLFYRLVRMTCDDARAVINAVSVHNDKLIVLDCIKRALVDCNTELGKEFILSSFPYEEDKVKALRILATVRYDVHDVMAAGGHQGYAAVGGLFTQSRPLEAHLFGPIPEQLQRAAGHGEIKIPKTAQPGVVPSVYTGHPSYAYPQDKTYAEVRGYPETEGYPQETEPEPAYPAGAPPLSTTTSGAPAPMNWPSLHMREPSFQRDVSIGQREPSAMQSFTRGTSILRPDMTC
ncbi:uncharacterized protein [Watersipora subatra]|uniref:uncharacterized protein n=1 Tax=Watersipora subatra TaxID=2589382 RepID=UPI00355C4378